MMRLILLAVLAGILLCGCAEKRETPTESTFCDVLNTTPDLTGKTEAAEERPLLGPILHPHDTDFVRVKDYIPGISVDLKYAGQDNFTGQAIYGFQDAYLRYGTVLKLQAVCEELAQQGLYLKIWDSFRPVAAQFQLWEVCPNPTFVSDPNVGFSDHSRGNAVDITLVDSEGKECPMPSGFDDFTSRAFRDYTECSPEEADNARLLEAIMEKHGFSGYWGEWWHFRDAVEYEVERCFDPMMLSSCFCLTHTPLLESTDGDSDVILMIPEGECMTLLGYQNQYAMVEYWGYRGFVLAEYLRQDSSRTQRYVHPQT